MLVRRPRKWVQCVVERIIGIKGCRMMAYHAFMWFYWELVRFFIRKPGDQQYCT